jgi:SAM-dependent methyltransferase
MGGLEESVMSIPPSGSNTVYAGRRILEAMHEAVLYARTIFGVIESAMPASTRVILEFGAGDGAFVKMFHKRGVAVDCVEIDNDLRHGLLQLAPHVYSSLSEVKDGSCDFIYSVNVLEHISDLDRELGELNRKLRPPSAGPGGTVFIFVPAFRVLWTSLDDEVGHVTRFTRKSLKKALEDSGLEIQRMEYFDSLGFTAALTVRALEKMRLFRYGGSSVKFYDRYVFPVSRKLDFVCRYFVGKNIIAVARRVQ